MPGELSREAGVSSGGKRGLGAQAYKAGGGCRSWRRVRVLEEDGLGGEEAAEEASGWAAHGGAGER